MWEGLEDSRSGWWLVEKRSRGQDTAVTQVRTTERGPPARGTIHTPAHDAVRQAPCVHPVTSLLLSSFSTETNSFCFSSLPLDFPSDV